MESLVNPIYCRLQWHGKLC